MNKTAKIEMVKTINSRNESIEIPEWQARYRTLLTMRCGYSLSRCTAKGASQNILCWERSSTTGERWNGSTSPYHCAHSSPKFKEVYWPDELLEEFEAMESQYLSNDKKLEYLRSRKDKLETELDKIRKQISEVDEDV